jgi:hypothetical protein
MSMYQNLQASSKITPISFQIHLTHDECARSNRGETDKLLEGTINKLIQYNKKTKYT